MLSLQNIHNHQTHEFPFSRFRINNFTFRIRRRPRMGDFQIQHPFSLPPPPLPPLPTPPSTRGDSAPPPPRPSFDPSRMIGVIRRKALIKELAAVYHAECLTYCQELLELQKKMDEPFVDIKVLEEPRKENLRPPKRQKKTR